MRKFDKWIGLLILLNSHIQNNKRILLYLPNFILYIGFRVDYWLWGDLCVFIYKFLKFDELILTFVCYHNYNFSSNITLPFEFIDKLFERLQTNIIFKKYIKIYTLYN